MSAPSSAPTASVNRRHEVLFPCVHGKQAGELVTIWAFPAQNMAGRIKILAAPISDEDANRIVSASRYAEHDERKINGVIASVSGATFSGHSYDLALAIVDKLSRYNPLQPSATLVATGVIPASGDGQVAVVGELGTKLRVLARERRSNTILVLPLSNLEAASSEERSLLSDLESQGARVVAIEHVDDLVGILWSLNPAPMSPTSADVPRPLKSSIHLSLLRPLSRVAFGLLLLLIVGSIGFLVMGQPGGSLEAVERTTVPVAEASPVSDTVRPTAISNENVASQVSARTSESLAEQKPERQGGSHLESKEIDTGPY